MHILIATKQTQGQRDNDFSWTDEGELVMRGFMCNSGLLNPDEYCGCGRVLIGVNTARATTTIQVTEAEMTPVEYVGDITASLQGRWPGTPEDEGVAEAMWLLEEAAGFDVGTVLEYRSGVLVARL